jgi:hypothetical protein
MRRDLWLKSMYFVFSVLFGSAMVFAGTPATCQCGKPTPESYKWNFSKEASQILGQVQLDAYKVRDSAAELRADDREPAEISWQSEGNLLERLRDQVNAMDAHICRLRIIERVTDGEQQATINRILPQMVVVSDETQAAIRFLNHGDDHHDLFAPRYYDYGADLYASANRVYNDLQQGGWEYMAKGRQAPQTSKS